ncbi:MAG: CHAT domain-containing protein, partial [Nannocystaceae bacterium]
MASRDIVVELARTENPDDPHGFRFVPQTYTVRTEGGGRRSFEVAWSRELLAELDAVRRPGRDPEVVARLGERLRVMLAPTGLEALVNELPGSQDGALATITLRSSAAEIYALPMELITRRETGEHVGALPRMLIRYEWPETRTTPPSVEPRPEGGRILFAWSAAAGPVAASDQLQAIREEAARGNLSFSTDEDVVEHASCGRITAALAAAERAERPFAILHLLCHGAVAGSSYGLALDDEDGDVVVVDAGRLRQLLAPYTGTLRLVVLAACDGGNVGDPGSRLGSVAQTLHRAGIEAVVASRYPLSVSGAVTLTRRLYHELLVRLRSLEEAFVAARVELGGDQATLDWASVQLHARIEDGGDTRPIVVRPYRGLLPFQTCHSRLFFGRDRERTEILRDLAALTDAGAPRLLVVAGASGTGKSSLVLAGAVPDLVGDEAPPEADGLRQRAVSCLEELAARGDDPAAREALAALRRSAHPAARGDGWECAVMRPGVNPNARLAEALAGRVDPGRSLLLVVDQFEELFTHTAEPSERERFGRRLWALARGDDDVHCILTIRVDFLGRCGEIVLDDDGVRLDRVAYDEQHRVFIAQMGPEQLRGAIEGPARLVGLSLQEGLSARMLDEVRGEPGALPLLQYALDLLWQRRRGRLLSMEEHERLGGVAGALQRRADALVDE